jgi:NADPH:quinone reductase-like Zn-dependent oxidoreductase
MKGNEIQNYKLGGSYAEYCLTDALSCIPITDEFSFEEAASFFVNPLTAICMVDRIKLLKSKCVIITAACS